MFTKQPIDPDVLALVEFKDTLPLTVKDQHGVQVQFVDLYKLHSSLDVKTRPRQWFALAVTKYGFVKDEDYLEIPIDTSTAEGRLQLKSGAVVNYWLSTDMAKELCMVQASDIGRAVRKYFLIAERVAKKHAAEFFKAELQDARLETKHAKQQFLEADKIATQAALAAGYKSGTHCLLDAQATEKVKRLSTNFNEAQGAALMMWEQCTVARRHAKQGRTAQALEALERVEQAYGTHSDMLRNSPPWASSL